MSAYTVRTERIAIGRPRTVIWWELTSITVETERHHTTTDDKTVEGHCFLVMTIRLFSFPMNWTEEVTMEAES